MKIVNWIIQAAIIVSAFQPIAAFAKRETPEQEGRRLGIEFRADLIRKNIDIDKWSCVLGVMTGDKMHPEYTQAQIEAWTIAFANACMARKVL